MNRVFYKGFRNHLLKALAAVLCALCVGSVSGCTGPASQEVTPVQAAEKAAFVTCFGEVRARVSQTIRLPFDVQLQGIAVREGQLVGSQDVLFSLGPAQLEDARVERETALEALQATRGGYEAERTLLEAELAVCQLGVAEFDVQAVMEQLRILATRKDSASQIKAARLDLLETLRRFDLLESYDALLAYAAAKDRFYYETANPLLERLDGNFDRRLAQAQSELGAKAAQISRTDLDILAAQERFDRVQCFADGQESVLMGENGAVMLANDGWMVDNILVAPDASLPADGPILRLIRMDSLEAVCYVEEQLINGIRVGDPVQLTLYADSKVIHLGSVVYIAQKAAERNGETMVELIVDVQGEGFLPGYNVVARIAPQKSP